VKQRRAEKSSDLVSKRKRRRKTNEKSERKWKGKGKRATLPGLDHLWSRSPSHGVRDSGVALSGAENGSEGSGRFWIFFLSGRFCLFLQNFKLNFSSYVSFS
jgi:hypothetical protein